MENVIIHFSTPPNKKKTRKQLQQHKPIERK